MNKEKRNKKRILSLLLALAMVLSLFVGIEPPMKAEAASFNNSVGGFELYSSGCLKKMEITIDAVGSYATAYGKIAIHTQPSRYGWNNRWTYNGNSAWPNEIENDGFVTWGSGNEFLWSDGNPYVVTVGFDDGVVNLSNQQTYYVYLWTRATAYGIYPDAKIYELKTENGKLSDSSGNVLVEEQQHNHSWQEATCETAKTCSVCGETEGTSLGHRWQEASCETAKTCSVCGETEGTSLGHRWTEASCETAKTCSVCGETEGTSLGHSWTEATCEMAKNCSVCGATEGEAHGHDWSGEWTVIKEATATEEGKQETYCTRDCGQKKEEMIPATGETTTPEPEDPTATPKPEDPTTTPKPEDPTTTPEPEDPTTTPTPEAPTPPPLAPTPSPVVPAPVPPTCSHNWQEATCETEAICSWCGGRKGFALGHDWSDATCTEAKTCDRCGETEGDALGHDWSGKWTVIKEATATEEGKQELLCARDCGQKKMVTIPAIGVEAEPDDNGNLEKDAEVAPEAPIKEATLDNKKSELIEAGGIFTEKEKKEVENGAVARVWIEISKTNEEGIVAEDKAEIKKEAEKIMGEMANVNFFDADLFKQVGDGKKTQISEPGIAMKITITIPERLLNHNKKVIREYKVLRLHDGVVEVLEGIFDALTGEFFFESDKFSTYAIAYIDTPVDVVTEPEGDGEDVTEPEGDGEDVTTPEDGGEDVTKPEESDKDEKDDVPKTGEGTNAPLMWTLLLLLTAAIFAYGKKWQERHEE